MAPRVPVRFQGSLGYPSGRTPRCIPLHTLSFWIFFDGIGAIVTCCAALDSWGCSASVKPLGSALSLLATLDCDGDSSLDVRDSSGAVDSKDLSAFLTLHLLFPHSTVDSAPWLKTNQSLTTKGGGVRSAGHTEGGLAAVCLFLKFH